MTLGSGSSELVLSPSKLIAGLPILRASEASPYINFMVYGESGVGKTRLLGSCDEVPELRKVLFLDIEGGTRSIRDVYPNIETVRVRNWKEISQVFEFLKAGNHGYTTVCVDSLTEMQKFNMTQVMKDLISTRPDLDADIPGMREWGKNLEQMRKYVRLFRDLPMNTMFTCLVQKDKDQKTGALTSLPGLSGKLAREITAFLDVVCYAYMKEVEGGNQRMLLTGATATTVAKDRTGQMPMVIVNPTMPEIYKYIVGKRENNE